jgi:hypothetical protein
MVQTEYLEGLRPAFPGMIEWTGRDYSMYAVEPIKMGVFVTKKTATEKGAENLNSSSDRIYGFTTFDRNVVANNLSGVEDYDVVYPVGHDLAVRCEARGWVYCEGDIDTDDSVFVRFASDPEIFTLTFDADLVALNKVNGTINGVAIEEVTFTADHATTMQLLANSISRLANVGGAVVSGARVITITGATGGEDLSSTGTNFTVTLGAGQAADAIANVSGPSSGTIIGAVRKDADDTGTGASAVALTQARVLTSAADWKNGTKICRIEVNLP